MNCSIRHNVREALVTEGLAVLENTDLRAVVSEAELVARSYTMAQELLEEYGVDDIPYMVSDDRIIMNEELFRQLDGAAPEIQQEMEDELLASMRNVMHQLGLSATMVDKLRDREGNPIQGVAAADLLNRSIQYLEGKESELPEEVIHFYVQALKDTSDPLYASMRARITSEPEYEQVLKDYQDVGYTDEDFIDEAIAKVILNRVRGVVKTGVSEVFTATPELSQIGSQEQYSAYLNTIFPDSTDKDIFHHGTTFTFDTFKFGMGSKFIFFTKDADYAYAHSERVFDTSSKLKHLFKLKVERNAYLSRVLYGPLNFERDNFENLVMNMIWKNNTPEEIVKKVKDSTVSSMQSLYTYP